MLVFLDGQILPAADARISPFDRGFLFGDGIYEGLRATALSGGRAIIGLNRHIRRMQNGLDEIGIMFDAAALARATDELLDTSKLSEAFVYWQVTRGTPPAGAPVRSRIPAPGTKPTSFIYVQPLQPIDPLAGPAIKSAGTQPDLRWLRGTIKSISLLGNLLASIAAHEAGENGGEEAILIRSTPPPEGGLVTEGTYTNVLIVTEQGELATPSMESAPLLDGITRQILLGIEPEGRKISVRAVREAELATAREVILLGTTTMVTSITRLDGRPVSGGKPGPVAQRLSRVLIDCIAGRRDDIGR